MKASQAKLSIALVTRNRPESLRRCLASLRQQTVTDFEIVVSDDSDDAYIERTREIALEFEARYVVGPRKGLYANRNHIVKACHGTHLLSADDDHEYPPNYVERVLAAVNIEPSTIWCMGEVYDKSSLNAGPWHGPGQINPRGALVPITSEESSHVWGISDGATVYPRFIFNRFRFFEKIRFGDGYKEFGCLLHFLGFRIRPLRDTGPLHHLYEVGRSFEKTYHEFAATYFAMLMFSFFYQRRLVNMLITTIQLVSQFFIRPRDFALAIPIALRWFKARRRQVIIWKESYSVGDTENSALTEPFCLREMIS